MIGCRNQPTGSIGMLAKPTGSIGMIATNCKPASPTIVQVADSFENV